MSNGDQKETEKEEREKEGVKQGRKEEGREGRENRVRTVFLVTSDCYKISLNGHFKLHVFNSHSSECREVQC